MSEKLTEHFSLGEMTLSSTAVRKGLDNTPDAEQRENLRRLCVLILEPLRASLKRSIRVSSGLRVPAVNKAVGGAAASEHCFGRAADILVEGLSPLEVCREIERLKLPFNQVIHEFGVWCHVSVCAPGSYPRRERLTARKVGKKTVYSVGLEEI